MVEFRHILICHVRECRGGPRQMSMSYVSRLLANVATRHDITSPKSLANVATCRNVSSFFAHRGSRRRFGGKKIRPKAEKLIFVAKIAQRWHGNGKKYPNNFGREPFFLPKMSQFGGSGAPRDHITCTSTNSLANVTTCRDISLMSPDF